MRRKNVQIKILALAAKENEIIFLRDKKQIIKREYLGKLSHLKNLVEEMMLENDKVSFKDLEG